MTKSGTLLIIIAAVCFGVAAPAVKFALNEGATPIFALAVRFSAAALILWIYNIVLNRKEKMLITKKQLTLLFLTGGAAYFATTMFYYNAIIYIPVSLHVIVYYIYPSLINIFSVVVLKEKIYFKQILALITGFVGIIMMVGAPGIYVNWFGILLSFLAAVGNGSYVLMVGSKTLKKLDSITVTTYITTFAAISFIISGLWFNQLTFEVSAKGMGAMLFVAIFSTVVATITLYLGVKKIGASKASIICTLEPVIGVSLSMLLLSEKFVFVQIMGASLIILSVILVSIGKGQDKAISPSLTVES